MAIDPRMLADILSNMPEFVIRRYEDWQRSEIFAYTNKCEDILVFESTPDVNFPFQALTGINIIVHSFTSQLTLSISSCWPEPSSNIRIIFMATC
jgi:hypothetical protein